MPIRERGTEEYEHFRALRDTVIEPALDRLGYVVTRADDVAKGGAIAKDVVTRLASSDLVIADLTDLNANVFYELGVRHALRGQGTIMIIDTSRSLVPFDLKPYRVIEYTPDLRGVEKLRRALVQFTRAITGEVPDTSKDNPVHDYLPSLPDDIYAHVEGSVEGDLRGEIARLRHQLHLLGGAESTVARIGGDLQEAVTMALSRAQRGQLPVDLVVSARQMARQQNRVEFLSILQQLSDLPHAGISSEDYLSLSRDASTLDLPEDVRLSLMERAIELRPNLVRYKLYRLEAMAHSEDPATRELARRELLELLGIRIEAEGVVLDGVADPASQISSVGVMLDAFHRDGLHDDALAVTEALLNLFPQNTKVLRNHARALKEQGRAAESLSVYRAAVLAPDVDRPSAVWYGTMLSSREQHVDALEAYLLACKLDPDDAESFGQAADELTNMALRRDVGDDLPSRATTIESIDELIPVFISAALSCPAIDSATFQFVIGVARKAEIDDADAWIDAFVAARRGGADVAERAALLSRRERIRLASSLYERLSSEITVGGSASSPPDQSQVGHGESAAGPATGHAL
jgi:tetratricopeptide (TPR) repeat protein